MPAAVSFWAYASAWSRSISHSAMMKNAGASDLVISPAIGEMSGLVIDDPSWSGR